MGLLEYLNRTVPDLVANAVPSFYNDDPLLKEIRGAGKVKRSGGSNVRFTRIISGHSDFVEMNGANIAVPLAKKDTLGTFSGDWTRLIKPIIIPHVDMTRMQTPADKKRLVQDITDAVLQSAKNDVVRRIYTGDTATVAKGLAGLGSLNGGRTAAPNSSGTTSGFQRGAFEFDVPATQSATGNTYMGLARTADTTNDENNWYNQFEAHSGFTTDFLKVCERQKMKADSYAPKGKVSLLVVSIDDHVSIAEAIRSYPGSGASAVVYTPADLAAGKAHDPIHVFGGMKVVSNRFMTAARLGDYSGGSAINSAAYGINPEFMEWWVNDNNDFKVTSFHDGLETGNQDADIGYLILECQFAVPGLLFQFCTRT